MVNLHEAVEACQSTIGINTKNYRFDREKANNNNFFIVNPFKTTKHQK